MTLDVAWAVDWTRRTADEVFARRSELNELDRQIGDGDHGENMARGFTAVIARLDALEEPLGTVGDVLKLIATTLMSKVGGAAGPLYGTAYLRAAKVSATPALDAPGVVAMLEAALEGIVARGKATTGEKTMVDAWSPAVEAAVAGSTGGADAAAVLVSAASAAELGAVATIPLVATKGRASYLGERSAGHQDPGATSTAIVLRAASDAAAAHGA
ncbi:dihydroxyacetone kinase subunit DhaL [Pengzhenrongella frigida]|uniref:Dihydroxyacetone kinase subunit L n=1 Tax=Pengzhenrongella frigida TaxID=1259133 RepID=A0A4Q5N4W8_9MICO|nr:dihydroxyacetone kinase subunit DhaL [Cellulomonas sp. HLT2-17]RYV51757.1 dihydroxyacetone kinase subunit L [Cellulomonas sp. HLT2-17]